MPDIAAKKISKCVLVDISALDELRGIQVVDHKIKIGALTTINQLIHSELIEQSATVKEALSGNLCRCTGYKKIVDAVSAVAVSRTGGRV